VKYVPVEYTFKNLLKKGMLTLKKEVDGCAYGDLGCEYREFSVRIVSTGDTAKYDYWHKVKKGEPLYLTLPHGTYKVEEKATEGYEAANYGVIPNVVIPGYAEWTLKNTFKDELCADYKDNDYNGYSDCGDSVCQAHSTYCQPHLVTIYKDVQACVDAAQAYACYDIHDYTEFKTMIAIDAIGFYKEVKISEYAPAYVYVPAGKMKVFEKELPPGYYLNKPYEGDVYGDTSVYLLNLKQEVMP
jgi:hypothetical protein